MFNADLLSGSEDQYKEKVRKRTRKKIIFLLISIPSPSFLFNGLAATPTTCIPRSLFRLKKEGEKEDKSIEIIIRGEKEEEEMARHTRRRYCVTVSKKKKKFFIFFFSCSIRMSREMRVGRKSSSEKDDIYSLYKSEKYKHTHTHTHVENWRRKEKHAEKERPSQQQ